jgi:hypothetical protein
MSNKGKILVAITTGRPLSCQKSLELLAQNFHQHSFSNVDFLINYDKSFQQVDDLSFRSIALPMSEFTGRIFYAGDDFINEFHMLSPRAISLLQVLTRKDGYGHKKNLCMIFAALKRYEKIIFWDDDEYALHLEKVGDTNQWKSTDIGKAHFQSNADITFGFWTGYVSPIPDSFIENTSVNLRSLLTEALKFTTDVVDESTFLHRSATFVAADNISQNAISIEPIDGGKWISGGNLGVSVAAMVSGRVPAFYSPQAGRGEDSIFSIDIVNCTVEAVPAGIFHDAFGSYINQTFSLSKLATSGAVVSDEAARQRFAQVLSGWIGYSALLTGLTNPKQAEKLLLSSLTLLMECDTELQRYFSGTGNFKTASTVLQNSIRNLPLELEKHKSEQLTWKELNVELNYFLQNN